MESIVCASKGTCQLSSSVDTTWVSATQLLRHSLVYMQLDQSVVQISLLEALQQASMREWASTFMLEQQGHPVLLLCAACATLVRRGHLKLPLRMKLRQF